MAASTRAKFDAAVNVIRSLPKDGSFQPSQDLMLLFYGYFKQSTEGPCNLPKPSFWEVVKKAKWDAWNKLGNMDREEAMSSYVEELKKIIETMPQTQMVADFMETLGTFYELVDEKPLHNGHVKTELEDLEHHSDKANFSRDISLQLGRVDEEPGLPGDSDQESPGPDLSRVPVTPHQTQTTENSGQSSVRMNGHPHGAERNDIEMIGKDKSLSGNTSKGSEVTSENLSKETSRSHEQEDSETDGEEFCDSTDQIQTTVKDPSSTPVRVLPPGIHSGARLTRTQVNGVTMSPIPALGSSRSGGGYLPFSPAIPRLSNLRQAQLSDSLAVNSPGEDSLNTDLSVPLSPTHQERSLSEDIVLEAESDPLPHAEPRRITARGGGDIPSRSNRSSQLSHHGTSLRGDASGYQSLEQFSSRRGLFHPPGAGGGGGSEDSWQPPLRADLNEQIAISLLRLQQDMNSVISRLDSLERSTHQQNRQTMWWPFANLPGRSVFFVVVWPFLVHWILNVISKRRRRYDR